MKTYKMYKAPNGSVELFLEGEFVASARTYAALMTQVRARGEELVSLRQTFVDTMTGRRTFTLQTRIVASK